MFAREAMVGVTMFRAMFPERKGPVALGLQAERIGAAVVFVLVEGAALFISWKFRSRKGEDSEEFPSQTHGNTVLEIGWTILPALILASLALWSADAAAQRQSELNNQIAHSHNFN